jgi:hypothetical protein
VAGIETYRWLAWMVLLLLHLGGCLLWLLIQALASLTGVGLVWATHAAVIINRIEAAGGCGSRALLFPHTRGRAPHRRPRALRPISAREPPILVLLGLEKKRHCEFLGQLARPQRRGDAGGGLLRRRIVDWRLGRE